MPPKADLERTQSPNDTIDELKEKLAAAEKDSDMRKRTIERLKGEREEFEKKCLELQGKQADHNALLSRLERELSLGSTSPMDWDRSRKGDFVERVVNAFKTKAGGDASLKCAHEALIKQHQNLAAQFEANRAGYTVVFDVMEQHGLPKAASAPEVAKFLNEMMSRTIQAKFETPSPKAENYHAHVSAPEKGDIHIHLHIV